MEGRAREDARAAAGERLALAEELLREAVFRSRAKQAAGLGPAAGAPGCGLGEKAAVELELSEAGARLFARLWPTPPDAGELARLGGVIEGWVRLQDGLDRKLNHFLRDFRGSHGADRHAWAPEVLRAYERGLGAIHAETDERRAKAARELFAPDAR